LELEDCNNEIRVVIIDDDLNWIRLLSINIHNTEKDIIIVGAAPTVEKAVEVVKILEPDVVLLDINLTENHYDGIEAAYEIKKISNAKIIMLTRLFNEDLVCNSFTAGAVNYLSKSDLKRIPDVIRTICKETSAIEVIAGDYRRLKTFENKEKVLSRLSDAEKEVINLYIMGYKRKEIASSLGKTEDTIKNQVTSSLKKLNIENRKELLEKLAIRS
jgi:DNA-binding NarL/FixJ family response regulator